MNKPRIVVLGAGLGGTIAAYEIQAAARGRAEVMMVSESETYSFVPSNPWVAVRWREPEAIQVHLPPIFAKKGIGFTAVGAKRLHATEKRLELNDGSSVNYSFLVIATGPDLAFDEIEGLGPHGGHTVSVCQTAHASAAADAFDRFVENPGPIVVGAVQGASCYGPAYEFALILDTELRRRKIRDKVPMTFVTAEPYIGHLGLDGVGDTKGLLESTLRERHIKWVTNARIAKVDPGMMHVEEIAEGGAVVKTHDLPFAFSMMLPAFRGVAAVRDIPGLTNPRGFILIDKHQRNPAFPRDLCAGCLRSDSADRADARAGGRAQDRVHDRKHGHRNRGQSRCGTRRQGTHRRSDLERGVPGRFRRWRRGLRGAAANSAAQRQLGGEREMGAPREDRLREVLPAQGPQGRERAVLREAGASRHGHQKAADVTTTSAITRKSP